jgi:hypothetical protein
MNKEDLEKNCLDLAYKRYLQILNILLISFLAAIFTFVGALILNPSLAFAYVSLIVILSILVFIFYSILDEKFKNISAKIKSLLD